MIKTLALLLHASTALRLEDNQEPANELEVASTADADDADVLLEDESFAEVEDATDLELLDFAADPDEYSFWDFVELFDDDEDALLEVDAEADADVETEAAAGHVLKVGDKVVALWPPSIYDHTGSPWYAGVVHTLGCGTVTLKWSEGGVQG